MTRKSAELYQRIRSRVDSGKTPVGSGAHCALLDYEIAISRLPKRDKEILELASNGWTHLGISLLVGLSRSRVSHIVEDFLGEQEL